MDQLACDKDAVLRRLRKIEGQVKGIQRMIEENKPCMDILTQVAAVKAAVNAVGGQIIESNTLRCLERCMNNEEQDKALQELLQVLMRFTK